MMLFWFPWSNQIFNNNSRTLFSFRKTVLSLNPNYCLTPSCSEAGLSPMTVRFLNTQILTIKVPDYFNFMNTSVVWLTVFTSFQSCLNLFFQGNNWWKGNIFESVFDLLQSGSCVRCIVTMEILNIQLILLLYVEKKKLNFCRKITKIQLFSLSTAEE